MHATRTATIRNPPHRSRARRLAVAVALLLCQSACYLPPLPSLHSVPTGAWEPRREPSSAATSTGPEPEIVETPNEHWRKELQPRVRRLLDDGAFDELERTAADLLADTRPLAEGWSRLDTFYVAFKDQPSDTPDDVRRSRIDRATAWTVAKPQSTVARLVLAELWIGYAWLARGSGYASEVSADGRRLFVERLANAHEALDAARACPEKSPRWFVTAARIDLGEHWSESESRATFEEAIATYPRYYAYYFVRDWHLQPRWYGRPGEWERLAAESADRVGGADGDLLYARMAWDCQKLAYDNVIRESRIDWERVKRGLDELVAEYPDDLTALTVSCYMSAIAGDAPRTRVLLDKIGDRVDNSMWSIDRFKSCRAWAASH